jgi:hypothetical protein
MFVGRLLVGRWLFVGRLLVGRLLVGGLFVGRSHDQSSLGFLRLSPPRLALSSEAVKNHVRKKRDE